MMMLKCLDKQLSVGLGLSLAYFMVPDPPRALQDREVRHYVSVARLGIESAPGDAERRSCIFNTDTRANKMEMPRTAGSPPSPILRPCLHLVSDQGPVGSPAWFWLCSQTNVRATKSLDWQHLVWNLCQNCLKRQGLWPVILEYTVAMNFFHSPFGGDGFWNVFSAAGAQMFRDLDSKNPLFNYFYSHIAYEMGSQGLEYPSDTHQAQLWNELSQSPFLSKKGDYVRLGRWMSWMREFGRREKHWSGVLLILVFVGVAQGYWNNYLASPLFSDTVLDPPDDEPSSSGAQRETREREGGPQTVKEADEQLQKLRRQCKNTLMLVIHILCNQLHYRLARMIFCVYHPVQIWFDVTNKRFHDRKEMRQCLLEWCSGDQVATLAYQPLQQLSTASALHAMGIDTDDAQVHDDFGFIKDLDYIAEKAMVLAASLSGGLLMHNLRYSHNLPHAFLPLLSSDRAVVRATLVWLKKVWEWLLVMEEHACTQTWHKTVLLEMEWPQWVFVREVLVLLSEVDFDRVPSSVMPMLEGFLEGLHSTELNETAFGELRSQEEISSNNTVGSAKQWAALYSSQVAEGRDRPIPVVSEEARASTASRTNAFPSSFFSAWNDHAYSLGDKALFNYLNSDYTSPSSTRWSAASALLMASMQGAGCSQDAWLSLLVDVGDVVTQEEDRKSPWLVLAVCKWGVMLWPCRQLSGRERGLTAVPSPPRPSLPQPQRFQCITSLNKWRVVPSKIKAPAVGEDKKFVGVHFTLQPPGEPLAKHAARTCFKNLHVSHLKDLMSLVGLTFPSKAKTPKTEPELCLALLKHLLPELSADEYQRILGTRLRPKQLSSILLDDDNNASAEALLAQSDANDLQSEKKKYEKAHGPKKRSPSTVASTSTSTGASGGVAMSSAQGKVSLTGSVTPGWAKKYIPDWKDCSVSLDCVRHFRWVITYGDKADPPYSNSKVFGRDATQADMAAALMHCLRTVWSWHSDLGRGECPWDLQSLQLPDAAS